MVSGVAPFSATHTRLTRSRSDRHVAGVAGGLAEYLGVNPFIIRAAFVVLAIIGGGGVALYALGWLILPEEGTTTTIAGQWLERCQDRTFPQLVLVLLAIIAAAIAIGSVVAVGGLVLPIALLGAGIVVWSRRDRGALGPWWLWTAGGLLVIFALVAFVVAAPPPWATGATLAGGALLLAVAGHRWLLSVGLLLTLTLIASAVLVSGGGAGDRHVIATAGASATAATTSAVSVRHYRLGAGQLTVDLNALAPSAHSTTINARVGVGRLVILVPPGAAVHVDSHVGAGTVELLGSRHWGLGLSRTDDRSGPAADSPSIRIVASVGVGDLEIR